MSLKKEFAKMFFPWKNWATVQWRYYFGSYTSSPSKGVIASLTSYPARFKSLHLTLKSLAQQKVSAEKILLWIAHEDKALLPKNVLKLEKQGLVEIQFTEDTRSYKKIIPALESFSKKTIITFDDDVFYPQNAISMLLALHERHPTKVIANRTHTITTDPAGNISSYQQWQKNAQNLECTHHTFQTGVGGVLYPPNVFLPEVTNKTLFKQLAPHGDDIWLYWMMRLNGKVALKTDNDFEFYHWPFSQKFALYKQNVRQDGNDIQIQAMLKHFGNPLAMPIEANTSHEDKIA